RNAAKASEEYIERSQLPRARQIVCAFDPFDAAIRARHERVVLVAQAEIERQAVVDLPSIACVEGILPFTRGHQLVLYALARVVQQADQEGCVPVVAVRRLRSSLECGGVGSRIQRTSRTGTELRLPMIHPQPVERVPSADFVRSLDLRDVHRQRVGSLITLNGIPTVEISQTVERG